VKLRVLAVCAALSPLLLSACGGPNSTEGLAGAPATNSIVPLTRMVVVTAVYGKTPLPNLLVTLTRNSWPNGKPITKGKTGPKGRVTLSGSWTEQEVICAGAKRSNGNYSLDCEHPFPSAVELQFQPPAPPAGRKSQNQ
jgi:hypothetical protein